MQNQDPQKPKSPRKRPASKRLKINVSERARWRQILNEVDKLQAPISVLECIIVMLKDGTQVNINIQELLHEGFTPDYLEDEINRRLEELEFLIENVDFHINVEDVAKTVQPVTDSLLKNL
jgi:hypothetical protein